MVKVVKVNSTKRQTDAYRLINSNSMLVLVIMASIGSESNQYSISYHTEISNLLLLLYLKRGITCDVSILTVIYSSTAVLYT